MPVLFVVTLGGIKVPSMFIDSGARPEARALPAPPPGDRSWWLGTIGLLDVGTVPCETPSA
jgi:hypothetical protein